MFLEEQCICSENARLEYHAACEDDECGLDPQLDRTHNGRIFFSTIL